jgi:hypothetical protein
MADVFTNDLRIREQEVGANSGAWGGYLNTSLENIAEAFSYGTEALADSAAQTLTLADGASDELRSFYVKLTGTLSQATTVTLAPNTISKVWMIENATSGGYAVTISQGSGADVTVGNGNVKMIATDGAGSGGVVYDLLTDLELAGKLLLGTPASRTMSGVTPNFFIEGTSYADSGLGAVINANGAIDCPVMLFGKSRGTSLGSNTVVQNGDRLFTMRFDGSDGTNLEQAALIEAYVDAAPANNSVPGRLSFWTTNDGSQYATEKMRIDNAGKTTFTTGGNNTVTIGQFVDSTTFNVVSLNESLSTNLQGLIGGSNSSGDLVLQNGENGNLLFRTNGFNERMRIQQSGITQFFTGDGNSGIAEFHTNASSGSASAYISIRPQGTARGYIGNGTSLLSGADNSDFIVRGETYLLLNSGGNQQVATLTDTNDLSLNGNPRSTSYINGKLATNIVSNRRVAFYASGNMDATFRAQGSNSTYVGIMAGATRLSNDASYLYFANNIDANGGAWSAYIKHITGDTAYKGKLKFLTNDGSLWHNALEITNTGTDKVLTNSGDVGTISDQRLKKNIEDLTYSLEIFKALKPRTFEWINPSEHEEGTVNGFIAQELPGPYKYGYQVEETITIDKGEKVDNPDYQLVKDTNGEAFAGTLGQSDAMYVSIIQQLITKIEALETDVAALKGA